MAAGTRTQHGVSASVRRSSAKGRSTSGTSSSRARSSSAKSTSTRSTRSASARPKTGGAKAPAKRTSAKKATPKPSAAKNSTAKKTTAKRTPTTSPKKSAAQTRSDTRRTSPFVPLILTGSIVFAIWTFYPVLRLQHEQNVQVADLQAELTTLQERNDTLRDEIDDLKTPEGVERAARESLGYARPGEQIYVVTGEMSSDSQESAEATETPLWKTIVTMLLGY